MIKTLSEYLRELRIVNNYSQYYVADVIGKTRQTYSHYETGRRKPSSETLYKLATLYDVSVDTLLHLSVEFDNDFPAPINDPTPDGLELSDYLDYFNNPRNKKKFQYNTNLEKELLYHFQKMSEPDKKELIEIAKIKSKKKSQ